MNEEQSAEWVNEVSTGRVRYSLTPVAAADPAERPIQSWELVGDRAGVADEATSIPFREIGWGKPLLVEVHEIYTGNNPGVGAFGNPKKKNLLLSTAVRGWAASDAQPRAVNCITEERIGAKTHMTVPGVLNKGTSVVYYSPAMMLEALAVRFEMVFDEFDPATINALANGLRSAAGLPVFLPYGAYLLAAASLLKLVSDTGDKLFDGKPVFAREKELNFGRPGEVPKPGYYLLAPEDRSLPGIADLRDNYHAYPNGEYRHNDDPNRKWQGDYPYALYSLDGSNHDEKLGKWEATAITAEETERFYNVKNREAAAIDIVVEGLKSANDLKYWNAARKTKTALDAEKDAGRKEALQKKYDALKANILDADLKGTA